MEPEKLQVIVTIHGGCVTSVSASGPAEVLIVDFDNEEFGDAGEDWRERCTWQEAEAIGEGGFSPEMRAVLEIMGDDRGLLEAEEPQEWHEGRPSIATCPKCGTSNCLFARADTPVHYNITGETEQDWERGEIYDDLSEPYNIYCSECDTEWDEGKFRLDNHGFLVALAVVPSFPLTEKVAQAEEAS